MNAAWTRLAAIFSPDAVLDKAAAALPGTLAAVVVLVAAWLLWKALDRLLSAVFTRAEVDITAASFIRTLSKAALFIVGSLTALDQLGVDTTSILASLGVVGLTLGFAAQDTLSNIISGLFIFWDRPFVLGDLVELDGEYGRVERITLRSTRLVTPDGRMFAIPNKVAAGAKVASYTNFPNLRIDIEVAVGVREDLGRVRRVLLGLVEGRPGWLAEPAPLVVVTALGDYNVTLELRAWLEDERTHVTARMGLREAAFVALTEAGVDMPYETLKLQPLEVRQLPA